MGSSEPQPGVFRHSFTLTLRRDGTSNVTQNMEPGGSTSEMPPQLAAMMAGLRANIERMRTRGSNTGNASGNDADANDNPDSTNSAARTSNGGNAGVNRVSSSGPNHTTGTARTRLEVLMESIREREAQRSGQANGQGQTIPSTSAPQGFIPPMPMFPFPGMAEMPGLELADLISQSSAPAGARPPTPPWLIGRGPMGINSGGLSTNSTSTIGTDIGSGIGAEIMRVAQHLSNSGSGDGAGGQPVLVQVEVHPSAAGTDGNPPGFPPDLPEAVGALFQSLAAMQGPSPLKPASSHQLDVLLDTQAQTFRDATGENAGSCPICQERFLEGELMVQMPCCGNHHHRSCVLRWLGQESGRCPVCRKALPDAPAGPGDLSINSIVELKRRCTERNLDCSQCLEKRELVALLLQERQQQQTSLSSRLPRPILVRAQASTAPPGRQNQQQGSQPDISQSAAPDVTERPSSTPPPPPTCTARSMSVTRRLLSLSAQQDRTQQPRPVGPRLQAPQTLPESGHAAEALPGQPVNSAQLLAISSSQDMSVEELRAAEHLAAEDPTPPVGLPPTLEALVAADEAMADGDSPHPQGATDVENYSPNETRRASSASTSTTGRQELEHSTSSSSAGMAPSNSNPISHGSQAAGSNKRPAPDVPVRRRITGKRPRPN